MISLMHVIICEDSK